MPGEEQVAQYELDGFLIVEDLLSQPELETIRRRIVDIVEGRTDFPEEHLEFEPNAAQTRQMDNVRKLNNCAQYDQVFLDHARNPGILDVVESLLGPDIKLMGDQFFLKPPGGIEKTYHQDSPYFLIEPMALVSSWAAIDDVTLENGCMWVIPGSHRVDRSSTARSGWSAIERTCAYPTPLSTATGKSPLRCRPAASLFTTA